ncbi:MAG: hypothetical protein ACFFBC_07450 [Promethearchaeota archaeon]
MGNSGKGLAIFAVIVGILGAALAGYSAFILFTATDATNIKGTWYATDNSHVCSGGWEYLDTLELNFTVNSGENVYLFYNSYVKVEGFYCYFEIHIDGSQVGYQMQITTDDNLTFERFSVALQHYIPSTLVEASIGYGAHNASIYVNADNSSTIIASNSLFIQTFT